MSGGEGREVVGGWEAEAAATQQPHAHLPVLTPISPRFFHPAPGPAPSPVPVPAPDAAYAFWTLGDENIPFPPLSPHFTSLSSSGICGTPPRPFPTAANGPGKMREGNQCSCCPTAHAFWLLLGKSAG